MAFPLRVPRRGARGRPRAAAATEPVSSGRWLAVVCGHRPAVCCCCRRRRGAGAARGCCCRRCRWPWSGGVLVAPAGRRRSTRRASARPARGARHRPARRALAGPACAAEHEAEPGPDAECSRATRERLAPCCSPRWRPALVLSPLAVLGDGRRGSSCSHPFAVMVLGGLVTSTAVVAARCCRPCLVGLAPARTSEIRPDRQPTRRIDPEGRDAMTGPGRLRGSAALLVVGIVSPAAAAGRREAETPRSEPGDRSRPSPRYGPEPDHA